MPPQPAAMLVPAPWDIPDPDPTRRAAPPQPADTFDGVFWNVVRTYTGYSRRSLQLLQQCGVLLSKRLLAGMSSQHEALRPAVPPELLKPGAIPSMVDMEDLPLINCCDNTNAIARLRMRCSQYGGCLAQLVALAEAYSSRWGRLEPSELKQLKMLLWKEQEARIHEDEIRSFFSDLNFSQKGLRQLSPELTRFSNLTTLVLSNNPKLTSIDFLPPSCTVFVACGCSIRDVCASDTLVFLGLAYNAIKHLEFLTGLPRLRVLDLSCNSLFSIEATVKALHCYSALEDVTFTGCPMALLDDYRERLMTACPWLLRLDHRTQTAGDTGVSLGGTFTRVVDAFASKSAWDEVCQGLDFVTLAVEVMKLDGLATLAHTPVPREEIALSHHAETRGGRSKKKIKAFAQGPAYEWTTEFSFSGLWGGCGGVVVECKNLGLFPDEMILAPQSSTKRKMYTLGQPIEDVRLLGHKVTTNVPLTADLSNSIMQSLVLSLEVNDIITFPCGKCVKLTSTLGSLFADTSKVLLSSAQLPYSTTVRESFIISETALQEKQQRARELREKASVLKEDLLQFIQSKEAEGLSVTQVSSSRRQRNSVSPNGRRASSVDHLPEVRNRKEEIENLKLIASIEERRAEEMQRLKLAVTLEFTIGSPPKVVEEIPVKQVKSASRRKSLKGRR